MHFLAPGASASPRHKLFFALRPDAGAAARAVAIARALLARGGAGAWATPRARLHVSLNFLGVHDDRPADIVAAASAAVGRLRRKPFAIAFNRAATFGRGAGTRAVVLRGDEGVIGANLLHDELHRALSDVGLAAGAPRVLEPHLTLLRGDFAPAEEDIVPVDWTVRDLVLIDSRVGGGHSLAGRWRLDG